MAADRGAFIDQSQSFNVFIAEPTLAKLTSMHFYAWKKGLKTGMYYLRTQAAARPIQFTVQQSNLKKSTTTTTTPIPTSPAITSPSVPIPVSGSGGSSSAPSSPVKAAALSSSPAVEGKRIFPFLFFAVVLFLFVFSTKVRGFCVNYIFHSPVRYSTKTICYFGGRNWTWIFFFCEKKCSLSNQWKFMANLAFFSA